jgi:hypothetical protein
MKKLISKIILLFIAILSVFACKKEYDSNTPIDYSKYKIKQVIRHHGNTDTTTYFYNGENIDEFISYSNDPIKYLRKYIKNGNQFDLEFYSDNVKTHEGFDMLNTQGFIDTSRLTRISTMSFNNRSKSYYDVNGFLIRDISDYNTYINDYKKFYKTDGDNLYWIFDRYYPAMPANNTRDSIVFEYDLNKPLHVLFEFTQQDRYGKPNQHLVTKKLNYNTLSANVLSRTNEYQNEIDANGLVTKRILTIFNQPGNVILQSDTTYYSYYTN